MNDFTPVYSAVGRILKEQRAEIDAAILDQHSKVTALEQEVEELRKLNGQDLQDALYRLADANRRMEALTKKWRELQLSFVPYNDAEIRKQLEEHTASLLKLFAAGDVANDLRDELQAVQEQLDVLPSAVNEQREKNQTEIRHSIELLEQKIHTRLAQIEKAPGPQGERGIQGLQGAPGRDADPEAVALHLRTDEAFKKALVGPEGKPGEKGDPGQDGIGLNVKLWAQGIHRAGTLVQHDFGCVSLALKDTNARPGDSEDWERVGSGGFRWRGVKSKNASYRDGDLYIEEGTTFLVVDGKGRMLAKRGSDGKPGTNGADGRNAPLPLEIKFFEDGDDTNLALIFDDGTICETQMPKIISHAVKTYRNVQAVMDKMERALEIFGSTEKALNWFMEIISQGGEPTDSPILRFRGIWRSGTSYSRGDVVSFGNKLYIAPASTSKDRMQVDDWVLFHAGGGGSPRGNMAWRQREYQAGAIVYNPADNNWYRALQAVTAATGSPELQASAQDWGLIGGRGGTTIEIFDPTKAYQTGDLVLVESVTHEYLIFRAEAPIAASNNLPGTSAASNQWKQASTRPTVWVTTVLGETPANFGVNRPSTGATTWDPSGGIRWQATGPDGWDAQTAAHLTHYRMEHVTTDLTAHPGTYQIGTRLWKQDPNGAWTNWAGGGVPHAVVTAAGTEITPDLVAHPPAITILRPTGGVLTPAPGLWQGVLVTNGVPRIDPTGLALALCLEDSAGVFGWTAIDNGFFAHGDQSVMNGLLFTNLFSTSGKRDDVLINTADHTAWIHDGTDWVPLQLKDQLWTSNIAGQTPTTAGITPTWSATGEAFSAAIPGAQFINTADHISWTLVPLAAGGTAQWMLTTSHASQGMSVAGLIAVPSPIADPSGAASEWDAVGGAGWVNGHYIVHSGTGGNGLQVRFVDKAGNNLQSQFASLSLGAGDTIQITDSTGQTLRYELGAAPVLDVNSIMFPKAGGLSGNDVNWLNAAVTIKLAISAPFTFTWDDVGPALAGLKNGDYLLINHVRTDAQGNSIGVPAGIPGLATGTQIGVGDWLVAVDTNGTGSPDQYVLVRHDLQASGLPPTTNKQAGDVLTITDAARGTSDWRAPQMVGGVANTQAYVTGGGVATWDDLPAGAVVYALDTGNLLVKTHMPSTWQVIPVGSTVPVGAIISFGSATAPPGWLMCDGGIVPATYPLLRAAIGNTLPDLRNQFVRGSADQNAIGGFTHHQDTTRMPRNPFSGIATSAGDHAHYMDLSAFSIDASWQSADEILLSPGHSSTPSGVWNKRLNVNTTGAHQHTLNINGGDSETAPPSVYLAYIIKHD